MTEVLTDKKAKRDNTVAEPFLPALGVFGFGVVETVILAALVTEDPLLLIGRSGTGKTFLLNSLSEALGLEHRHYNASLISFDDLVGFPYPEQESGTVRFLQTPATVWSAQSVLIDELSRCKPEHQNRLFSLIHERRIQGLALPQLRYRWAAMNPASSDQNGDDDYLGSEALDPALADRFGLFVTAADWPELSEDERTSIANPGGEDLIANDGGRLAAPIVIWRERFLSRLARCPRQILVYVTAVVSHLNTAGIRISPRRARLIARSLLAGTIIRGDLTDQLFRSLLGCSLPQVTAGSSINQVTVSAAHRAAWDAARGSEDAWIHQFLAEPTLAKKVGILIKSRPTPDAGSQAIAQLLATGSQERCLAFAFATYPAAALSALPIGSDGVNDLAKVASPILSVDGKITWRGDSPNPGVTRYAAVLNTLTGARRERAEQFFNYCLVNQIWINNPAELELEIDGIVTFLRKVVPK